MQLDPDHMPTDLDLLTKTFHEWNDKWQPLLERWLTVHRSEQEDFAKLIEHVPEMVRLIVNLIKDPHIAQSVRIDLYGVLNYVYDANDTLPEEEIGVVGLVDDGVKLAKTLDELIARYTIQLRNNWSGKGDILEIVEYILKHGKDFDTPSSV